MFTGIVSEIGQITAVTPLQGGVTLSVSASAGFLSDVALGDSIAIEGACMTVTQLLENCFTVDVSAESLDKTCGLNQTGAVNLEKALQLSTRLGGHLVTGHIDGLGAVKSLKEIGESWEFIVAVPRSLAPYFAAKGSGCFNGVSLTTNTVTDTPQGCDISINLIPHTVANTTLKNLATGSPVNVEIDLLARYMQRMVNYKK